MSSSPGDPTAPISAPRFAAALRDLSLASLHLKVLELRNSLAHLAYSNLQLRPFADGTEAALGADGPDPDCADAIRENEVVMDRMRERILLVKAEVEGRGVSWREFEDVAAAQRQEEQRQEEPAAPERGEGGGGAPPLTNGVVNGTALATSAGAAGNPWTDGTFQTGTILNGEIHVDAAPGQSFGRAAPAASTTQQTSSGQGSDGGGRLTDEELRRMLEERLGEMGDDDEDEGLHL